MERVAEATQSLLPERLVDALLDVEEAFTIEGEQPKVLAGIIDHAVQTLALIRIDNRRREDATMVFIDVLTPSLGTLRRISCRTLRNRICRAVDVDFAGLHGEAQRVTVNLLKQPATHAKGDVFSRPAMDSKVVQDGTDGDSRDAISLDHADVIRENLVALGVDREAELGTQRLDRLQGDFNRITRVRTDDDTGDPIEITLKTLVAPGEISVQIESLSV